MCRSRMPHRALNSPIYFALAALFASIVGNIFAYRRLQGLERAYGNLQSITLQLEDDSHYSKHLCTVLFAHWR